MNCTTINPINHQKKKYTETNLRRFVECDTTYLSPGMKAARTRARRGLCEFYGFLPQEFPLHYKAFRNMHDAELSRGQHVDQDFSMTPDGLIEFILSVGSVPSNLHNPLLVRVDPEDGFFRGNLKWENAKRFRPESARRALRIANQNR